MTLFPWLRLGPLILQFFHIPVRICKFIFYLLRQMRCPPLPFRQISTGHGLCQANHNRLTNVLRVWYDDWHNFGKKTKMAAAATGQYILSVMLCSPFFLQDLQRLVALIGLLRPFIKPLRNWKLRCLVTHTRLSSTNIHLYSLQISNLQSPMLTWIFLRSSTQVLRSPQR